MNIMQKAGGIASLICATTFVIGFVVFFTLLIPARYGSLSVDPLQHVAFLAEHKSLMYAWNLIIYVAFGGLLVVLSQALNNRLKADSPALAPIATSFGLIWAGLVIASGMVANIGTAVVLGVHAKDPAQAAAVWLSLSFVVNGLGGGNEIVGGLWVLLISWAGLRAGGLPRALNYFGIVVSVAGLVTVVPALSELGSIFGLGIIVWFIWLGTIMLRGGRT